MLWATLRQCKMLYKFNATLLEFIFFNCLQIRRIQSVIVNYGSNVCWIFRYRVFDEHICAEKVTKIAISLNTTVVLACSILYYQNCIICLHVVKSSSIRHKILCVSITLPFGEMTRFFTFLRVGNTVLPNNFHKFQAIRNYFFYETP